MSPTAGSAGALLVECAARRGVTHLFANFGSDHPAIIEALAQDRAHGIDTPTVILCPHEYSAMSAAHGYALVTGRPQAVFVHTDVGTANLGGAVHNAGALPRPCLHVRRRDAVHARGRAAGQRNSSVNHLQDVSDQHGSSAPT